MSGSKEARTGVLLPPEDGLRQMTLVVALLAGGTSLAMIGSALGSAMAKGASIAAISS